MKTTIDPTIDPVAKPFSAHHFCSALLLFSMMFTSGCGLYDKMLPNSEFNSHIVQAEAALHDGNLLKAENRTAQARILQPQSARVMLLQGQIYAAKGHLAQAYNQYQMVINLPVNNDNKATVNQARELQAALGYRIEVDDSPDVAATEATQDPQAEALAAEEQALQATRTEIEQMLQAWLTDWQSGQPAAYFAHYVTDFKGEAASASAWRKARSARLSPQAGIQVSITALQIDIVDSDNANISFTQTYSAKRYRDVGEKLLELVRDNGRWLIRAETFSKQ